MHRCLRRLLPLPPTEQLLRRASSIPDRRDMVSILILREKRRMLTALPQLRSTSLDMLLSLTASLSFLRTMTTRAISMKKIIVVIRAARSPAPRVIKENSLDAPEGPRRIIPNDARRAKKARPHAIGWRTRAAVSAFDTKLASSSMLL